MVDIQSPTAEIREEKRKKIERRNHRVAIINVQIILVQVI